MTPRIGIALALAVVLTLAIIPAAASATRSEGFPIDLPLSGGATDVTVQGAPESTPPSSIPPGQGGTPPGQAKQEEPVPDEDDPDPTGLGIASAIGGLPPGTIIHTFN
jgi:hypothetical protein